MFTAILSLIKKIDLNRSLIYFIILQVILPIKKENNIWLLPQNFTVKISLFFLVKFKNVSFQNCPVRTLAKHLVHLRFRTEAKFTKV